MRPRRLAAERHRDRPHGIDDAGPLTGRYLCQNRADLLAGGAIERLEDLSAAAGESQVALPRVAHGAGSTDQSAFAEPQQEPAQVAGIEAEVLADLGGDGRWPMRE